MPSTAAHVERHLSHRAGWLAPPCSGANDGITSTAALIVGVAAADACRAGVFTAGVAALVAGAGSMAAGEYGSVSSRRDSELADIAKERLELETMPDRELKELTRIYIDKGLSAPLAHEVAVELSKGDVLAVHMAEELGLTHATIARPLQAATSSALSFAAGAADPARRRHAGRLVGRGPGVRHLRGGPRGPGRAGAAGARAGGAAFGKATVRMLVLGGLAMVVTAVVGTLLGATVG